MTPEKKHKVIITGTGRAGTTLLVELLTELGLDTGYASGPRNFDYHEHCHAGLEREVEDPAAPYIIKNPALCETLPDVLARGLVKIDFALIPIRQLDNAAASRIRVGGDGHVPGGLRGTDDPARQKTVLAENFHRLIETLSAHDIPHVFLHFPRFVHDARYTHEKLQPILAGIGYSRFEQSFKKVAKPGLIHSFAEARADDTGVPARTFHRKVRQKTLRRRIERIAAFTAFFAVGWGIALWSAHRDTGSMPRASTLLASQRRLFPYEPLLAFQPPPRFGAFGYPHSPGFGNLGRPHPFHFQNLPHFMRLGAPRFPPVFASYSPAGPNPGDLQNFGGLEFFSR